MRCNTNSDCRQTACSFCALNLFAGYRTCVNPACCSNSDCTENPLLPYCSDEGRCEAGCRTHEDCVGCKVLCNLPDYDNCNYCDIDAGQTVGGCSPGSTLIFRFRN